MTLEEALGNLIEKYGSDEFTWGFVQLSQSRGPLFQELQAELNETHPLYDRKIQWAIAKCYANDDTLFLSEDGKYYIVHLTYSKTNSTGFPHYFEFSDLESTINHIEEQYLLSQQADTWD